MLKTTGLALAGAAVLSVGVSQKHLPVQQSSIGELDSFHDNPVSITNADRVAEGATHDGDSPLDEKAEQGPMTPARLLSVVTEMGEDVTSAGGGVQFTYQGIPMVGFWETTRDRMRIVSLVASVDSLGEGEAEILMEANFHLTLDARYAFSRGSIYAAYIHPLSPLDEASLRSGIRQVAGLVRNFGGSYSSGELSFDVEPPTIVPEGIL